MLMLYICIFEPKQMQGSSSQSVAMDSKELLSFHVFMFPFMAQGHMIPTIDMARLFAERGLVVTIITTPFNSSRFKASIGRAQDSGHRIRILHLPFPSCEVGLPEGCENIDSLSSSELVGNFITATQMLQNSFEELLKEHNPGVIVSDSLFPWTLESATKFHIPRLVFHSTSCFAQCCSHNMVRYATHEEFANHSEIIVIPDLPDRIEMPRAQVLDFAKVPVELGDLIEKAREADRKSFGIVFNTFYELEPAYINYYQTVMGTKAWPIGPVSLCNKELVDKADRGKEASVEHSRCLDWLNSNKPRSVLYVCFGSICRFPPSQLMEIAMSLEACNHPFIWVISSGDKVEEWLPEDYEERIGERGLLIRGWAPQILILSHPSTGGFMTHCGWNSILEGVSAGVPFLTWPIFAEQFYNEKMIVQVWQTGVGVGNEVWTLWEKEEGDAGLVKREKIEHAVDRLMGGGEEAQGMRKRAREYGEMARRAMEEGGSSNMNMNLLIDDLMHHQEDKSGDL